MKNYHLLKFIVISSVFAAQQLVPFGSSGCVNGRWEEDTCVCNEGYETVSRVTVEPSYCTKRSVVVIHIVNTSPWNRRDVLDITLPIVSYSDKHMFCVYILGCCFVGVVYTVWQIGLKFWSKETLRRLRLQKAEFDKMTKKYKNVKMLDADVWILPPIDYTVLNSVEGEHIVQYKRAKVLLDYKAQDAEELNLKKGDVIVDIIELENGWWQGDLNGQIGYFPGGYVKFLDNTKKTGSAIEMNDPEWTQGIQETAKTLQYKRMEDKESKKRDDEIVSETSSMYIKDLAEVKKDVNETPKKKWMKKSSEDVTVVAKRKAKHTTVKEDEERLLISSDSKSISSEYDTGKKDRRKGRKEKRRKDKDKQERKQTEDTTKETHVEDNKLSLTEKDSQLSETRQKKKGSRGRKRGKTEETLTKDSNQFLVESDSQISAETQEKQKVMEKESKNREQERKEKHREKQSLRESGSQASIDRKNIEKGNNQHDRKQKYKKMSLVGSDIELSDETHFKDRKEGKHRKRKRKDRRTSDKSSTIKKAESVESIEKKQKSRTKEAQSEKQQSMTQSDISDEKQHNKKHQKSAKESKHKQKKILSDEEFSEKEQPSIDKKHKEKRTKEKQNEQKALSQSTETETSSEQRKKSKGKRSKGKQPKKDVTESSDDNFDDDDEPSVTISDVQFLTESEEEKPKKGFFKKLFKF